MPRFSPTALSAHRHSDAANTSPAILSASSSCIAGMACEATAELEKDSPFGRWLQTEMVDVEGGGPWPVNPYTREATHAGSDARRSWQVAEPRPLVIRPWPEPDDSGPWARAGERRPPTAAAP